MFYVSILQLQMLISKNNIFNILKIGNLVTLAAATDPDIPISVIANRPFLFGIQQAETFNPIFIDRFSNKS